MGRAAVRRLPDGADWITRLSHPSLRQMPSYTAFWRNTPDISKLVALLAVALLATAGIAVEGLRLSRSQRDTAGRARRAYPPHGGWTAARFTHPGHYQTAGAPFQGVPAPPAGGTGGLPLAARDS